MHTQLTAWRALRLLLIGTALLLSSWAWAWPPTYGAEFELSRPGVPFTDLSKVDPSSSHEKKDQMLFVEKMRERCLVADCKVVEVNGKFDKDYRVEYKDGWWFKISYDPGCVEITFKPSTLGEMKDRANLINDQIFETGRQIGLRVKTLNSSHFNMGVVSAFRNDAKLFLRFFVDYANHPDLAMGTLGKDYYNAPPLSVLKESQREALNELVEKVNAGKITSIQDVAYQIQRNVYTHSYEPSWGGIDHYQAVGLKYVNRTNLSQKDAPLEIRAVWAQDSAERFIQISEMIEKRIAYLSRIKEPIVYTALEKPAFSNSELVTRFAIYLEEAGMSFQKNKELLPESLREVPLENLVRADVAPEVRLQSLPKYWDMLISSSYVREVATDLLAHPANRQSPVAIQILQRLEAEAPRRAGLLGLFKKPAPVQTPLAVQNIYRAILDEVEKKAYVDGGRTLVPRSLHLAPLCQGVFL